MSYKTKYYAHGDSKTYELTDEDAKPDRKLVLVLEDDPGLSTLLRDFLEANNFAVAIVTSGAEGLQKVMHTDYDAILCDMVMPNFPGDMFYRAVERVRPHLCKRFVFMTGHLGDPQIDAFIRSVKGLMLWKPFQVHEVIEAIKTIIRKSSSDGSTGRLV
jgi:DNA-binding response OmpR family regulator